MAVCLPDAAATVDVEAFPFASNFASLELQR